jgi:hypothetical protein
MSDPDVMWVAECLECCAQRRTYKEYRADEWGDSHTDETGHKTMVTMEVDA